MKEKSVCVKERERKKNYWHFMLVALKHILDIVYSEGKVALT